MGFVIGQKVIPNKEYIKRKGYLEYGGWTDMKYHIDNGNKPVIIVDTDTNFIGNKKVYIVKGIGYSKRFGLDKKEILPLNNSIQKVK